MKNIITAVNTCKRTVTNTCKWTAAALALGLTLTTASPVNAMGVEDCAVFSDGLSDLAQARDWGLGPQDSYDIMLQGGISEEMAVILLKLIYVDGSGLSPSEIENMAFALCLSEAT